MYSKEKIYEALHGIVEESNGVKPYIVIAQPRRDLKETPAQSFNGATGLNIDLNAFSHAYCNVGGEKVDVARNYLIEECIESGAKYMLFIGEDTVLPTDAFLKLHETAEKNPDAMVVGVYYVKGSVPMIMVKQGDYVVPANVDPGQIIECWQTGLDCALIPIKLLKEMKEKDPDLPWTCIANNIESLPFIGEDNFFQYRWRKAGYRTLCDTNVQCLHMDLATGKYTAHPSVDLSNYVTLIPITEPITNKDIKYLAQRWVGRIPEGTTVNELEHLAQKYSTDKSPVLRHSYTDFYYNLLKDKKESVKSVLEIGIGLGYVINGNENSGKPGPSLKMWRDFFPNAKIIGIDINEELLFEEDRIKTQILDQGKQEDLFKFANISLLSDGTVDKKSKTRKFDLIVDDGSHKKEDQIVSILSLLQCLRKGGFYVIEDVENRETASIIQSMLKDAGHDSEMLEFNIETVSDDRIILVRR